jgi:hypothetical protein
MRYALSRLIASNGCPKATELRVLTSTKVENSGWMQGDDVDFTFSNPPIAFDDFDVSVDQKLRDCFFALRAS